MYLPSFSDSHTHIREAVNYVAHLPEMQAIGLNKIALVALSIRPWGFSGGENWDILYVKQHAESVPVYTFGSLTYEYFLPVCPYEKQAELLLNMGFDGMKFIEMKPTYRRRLGFGLNHPKYDKMFAYLEKVQAPVVLHACDPDEYWTNPEYFKNMVERGAFYGDGSLPTKAEMNQEVFDILDKYPNLNVILAHFFFLSNDIDEAVRVMEKYPGVKFDLTPGSEMYRGFSKNIEAWREFFVKYRHRILYGTDNNESNSSRFQLHEFVGTALTHDHSEYMTPFLKTPVRGLALDEETVHTIAVENFDRYFGRKPKPINETVLREVQEYIREYTSKYPAYTDYARVYAQTYLDKMNRV